jgi:hypothetical protein
LKKFENFVKFAAVVAVTLGIVWSTFAYNTRPLPFDGATTTNPVEEIAKDAADKVNETAKKPLPNIDFGKMLEDAASKVEEFGDSLNKDSSNPADSGAPTNVDLSAVKIGDPRKSGYDRDSFGDAWEDVDRNGCDTRNDILARDLTQIVRTDNCTVASGILADKYTGETINFVRGKSKVDIDHVIPLSYAFKQGAGDWTAAQREALANDPANLSASSATANRSKSDSGPAEWMPTNSSYHCEYGKKFAAVAVKYDLPITQADFNTIQSACR